MSDLSRIKFAAAKILAREGSAPLTAAMDAAGEAPRGVLTVLWSVVTGGTPDAVTAALIGGVETPLSGTLAAVGVEEGARSVLRQFQEIETGDLIVDLLPNPTILLFPGQAQSGVVALADVANQGARFLWPGNPGLRYVQAGVGEKLASAWSVAVQGVPLSGTILLRRAT